MCFSSLVTCAPGAEGVCFLWAHVKMCHHLSTALVTHKNGPKHEQDIVIYISDFALCPSNFWANSLNVISEEEKRISALYYGLVWSHVQEHLSTCTGACQCCCTMSKEGLINGLGTWLWTKQQCGFGNTVNKRKTQIIKQNLFLLWGIYSHRKNTRVLNSLYKMLPLDSQLSRLSFQFNHVGVRETEVFSGSITLLCGLCFKERWRENQI